MDDNNVVYGVDVSKAKLVIARCDVQAYARWWRHNWWRCLAH